MTKIKNMDEFAAASGVSRPTLSKYFHDHSSVRKSSRQKIEAALELYDYRPNLYAMNQNRKLTKNIGIVVPHLADPFFNEMSRTLELKCMEAGFSPSLYSPYGDPTQENNILDLLRSLKPAGVLIAPMGDRSDRRHLERFCKQVPTVLFDSDMPGIGEAFIGSDNHSFISQSVEYLVRTGEPPLFFEMKNPANPNAHRRHDAFIDSMNRLNLDPEIVQIDGDGCNIEEIGLRGAHDLLAGPTIPQKSILCSNDRLALGFLSAAYQKGLTVGRLPNHDLRVASNDDHPFSKYTCPSLTTVAHDYHAVASQALQTLIERIENGQATGDRKERRFPARLVLRDSA